MFRASRKIEMEQENLVYVRLHELFPVVALSFKIATNYISSEKLFSGEFPTSNKLYHFLMFRCWS